MSSLSVTLKEAENHHVLNTTKTVQTTCLLGSFFFQRKTKQINYRIPN